VEANANWQYSANGGTSWSVALNATTTSFLVGQGSYTTGQVQVRQIDAAGNISPVNSSFQAFTVDTGAPAVSSVVATGAGISGGNGYLNAGKLVSITINSSEPITISGGIPTLSLNSGGSAAYASGSGTNALVFNYTVTAGNTASDLSITGLNANGAILSDAAGNSFASFSNNPAGTLVIDTTAPATPMLALANDSGVSNSDGITNNGTVNVTGLEAGASWEYSTNVGGSWVNGTGSSFVLSSGSYNAGSVLVRQSDMAGNTSANGQLGSIIIDTSAPLAPGLFFANDIGISNSDGITNNGTINVSGLEIAANWQYSTNGGSSWFNGTGSSFQLASGNYGSGTILVRQSDIAGNVSANGQPGAITVDSGAPLASSVVVTGTGISGGNGNLNAGKVVTITVNTSEPVRISGGVPTLSLNSGGSATYASGSGTNSLIFSYTVSAGNNASDLAITGLNANGASIADPAGNILTSFSFNPAGTLVVDTTAPTGSLNPIAPVSSTAVNGIYGIGAVINLVVQFSEAVFVNTTSGTPRLQLETGAIDRYAIYTGGSGTNTLSFSYTVQAGDSSADLNQVSSSALELNGGTIKDAAGNNANFSLATPGGVGSLAANAAIVIATAPPNSHLFTTVTQLEWDQNLDSFITATTYSNANFLLAEVTGSGQPFQGDKDADLNAKIWEKVRFGDLFSEYLPSFTNESYYYYYYGSIDTGSRGGVGLVLANSSDDFFLVDLDGSSNLPLGTNVGDLASWSPDTYSFVNNIDATPPLNSRLFSSAIRLEWDQSLNSFKTGANYSNGNFLLAEVSGTGRPFQGDKDGDLNARTREKVRFGDLFGQYLPAYSESSYYNYYGSVNFGPAAGRGIILSNRKDEFYMVRVDGDSSLSPGTNVGSWDSWLPNTYYFATNVVCFVAGTQIRTPQGERAIETLQPGDLISTANGVKPVKFVSRNTRHFNELLAVGKSPIRVAASAFGAAGPTADLLMSPSHALCLEGTLIEAAALLGHAGVSRVDEWQSQQLTYFNIELEQHELIWANGALTESYFSSYRSNGFSRQSWDNFDDYRALYGDGELMQELPMPRIAFSRQLPAALRARLQVNRVDLDLADLDLFTLEQPDQQRTNLNWLDELPTDLDLTNLNLSDCSRQGGNRLQPIKLHLNSQSQELSLAI
jgi:hypothetical protein